MHSRADWSTPVKDPSAIRASFPSRCLRIGLLSRASLLWRFHRTGTTWSSSGTAGDAANKEPALRAEALSDLPFINLWELVRERYPELFAFYGRLASALPTTACVEADFSRLRGTKPDYRSNLSCLSLEEVMQATDPLLADLVDVPFTVPARKAWQH
jgi:hypothetical protein